MKVIVTNFVKEFSENLSKPATSKIAKSVKLLKIFEYYLSMPYAKKVAKIILFHAFIKKTNKIPKRELKIVFKKINNIENT